METKLTFNSVIEEWLQLKKITLKESTYYRYLYMIKKYIIPYFYGIPVQELENFDYNTFSLKLLKNLTPSSTKNIIILLKSILEYINQKYNYHINLKFIVLPKEPKKELRVLTCREKNRLEKYCLNRNTLRDIGIIVCLNTGLRIGEICALKWDCINLEKRAIYVKKTMQRIYKKEECKSAVIIDNPKSQNSIRAIPISTKLYEILRPLKKTYPSNSFFLTGSVSSYVEPRNYQKMFGKCLKDCKIKNFHFHQLRHSFATDCINIGMDTKSLSEVLGHSNVRITLDKYVHSSFKAKKKYLEKL